jgi:hypothetical protein
MVHSIKKSNRPIRVRLIFCGSISVDHLFSTISRIVGKVFGYERCWGVESADIGEAVGVLEHGLDCPLRMAYN